MNNEDLKKAVTDGLDNIEQTFTERFTELSDRMLSLEQKGTLARTGDLGSSGPGPYAAATKALREDPAMAAAIQASQRNQKVSHLNVRANVDVSIKSILTNLGEGSSESGAYPTEADRNPNIVLPPMRPIRLLDVLPRRPTGSDSFEYVQLTAAGEASEQDMEGDEKAELDFEGTLKLGNIATIAGWTTASRQVLSDNSALASAINAVISHKVLSRLEHQLINGTGAAGKIEGLLANSTVLLPGIGTTPADIIGESMVKQADSGYVPSLILLNPLDWYRIQITKTTTEEAYVFGSPTMPVPPALWNARIVTTPSVPEGTGLTLDTSYTTVLDREQMSVLVSNSHKDYFTRNLVAILGELRAGLEVLDTGAVYQFDLTPSSGP